MNPINSVIHVKQMIRRVFLKRGVRLKKLRRIKTDFSVEYDTGFFAYLCIRYKPGWSFRNVYIEMNCCFLSLLIFDDVLSRAYRLGMDPWRN